MSSNIDHEAEAIGAGAGEEDEENDTESDDADNTQSESDESSVTSETNETNAEYIDVNNNTNNNGEDNSGEDNGVRDSDNDDDEDNEDNNEIVELGLEDHVHVVCPVCDLHFQVAEFRDHIMYNHPEMIAIWASALFGPMFDEDAYFDYIRGVVLFENENLGNLDVDQMSYEQLLDLCEEIGDHKEGIADVDQVLEKVNTEIVGIEDLTETKCPICLEEFATKSNDEGDCVVEKIKSCGHIYCSDCIRKWLMDNKKCPMCKSYIQNTHEM